MDEANELKSVLNKAIMCRVITVISPGCSVHVSAALRTYPPNPVPSGQITASRQTSVHYPRRDCDQIDF